jgi:hypothetical protein
MKWGGRDAKGTNLYPYQIAYLCDGSRRVAAVALVARWEDRADQDLSGLPPGRGITARSPRFGSGSSYHTAGGWPHAVRPCRRPHNA